MIIAIVPARSGSKRLKNKNIKILGEHTLIGWSLCHARDIGVDRIILSTDSMEYVNIAKEECKFDFDVHMRNEELSNDSATDLQVFQDVLKSYPKAEKVIHLRPTCPFRKIEETKKMINALVEETTSVRSIIPCPIPPNKIFYLNNNHYKYLQPIISSDLDEPWNLPKQLLQTTWHINGNTDIIRADVIRRGSMSGEFMLGWKQEPTVDIDTIEDFIIAESMIHKGEIMEQQCLDCTRKHLGTAFAYINEYETGRYPTHFWKAIGQMVCAENHTRIAYPRLAKLIETERLKLIDNETFHSDFDNLIEAADYELQQELKMKREKYIENYNSNNTEHKEIEYTEKDFAEERKKEHEQFLKEKAKEQVEKVEVTEEKNTLPFDFSSLPVYNKGLVKPKTQEEFVIRVKEHIDKYKKLPPIKGEVPPKIMKEIMEYYTGESNVEIDGHTETSGGSGEGPSDQQVGP